MTHIITETDHGLALEVDDKVQAVITDAKHKGCVDLVFMFQGPQTIEQARKIVVGLLDLLVHHDAASLGAHEDVVHDRRQRRQSNTRSDR